MLENLIYEIQSYINPSRAVILQKFFQTHKGGYGEGDIFLGINIPVLRKIAKKYKDLSMENLQHLISTPIHENRFVALVILILEFNKEKNTKKRLFFVDFYLKNTKYINNRDLVDVSAPNILGKYVLNEKEEKQTKSEKNGESTKILYKLSKSKDLWEKRISVVSCLTLIKKGFFGCFFDIAKLLLKDKHHLIHKAIGRMLREVGKINYNAEYDFLLEKIDKLPRTTLRYAIEKFPKETRNELMNMNK